MTVNDLIARALNALRVIALGDEATIEEADYCLGEYNDMMNAFELDGMALAHLEATLDDEIDVPDHHLEAIRLSLMERVAGAFGKEMTVGDRQRAETGRMALRAYHFSIAELGSDHPLAQRNCDS
jgi:hypothetical protein